MSETESAVALLNGASAKLIEAQQELEGVKAAIRETSKALAEAEEGERWAEAETLRLEVARLRTQAAEVEGSGAIPQAEKDLEVATSLAREDSIERYVAVLEPLIEAAERFLEAEAEERAFRQGARPGLMTMDFPKAPRAVAFHLKCWAEGARKKLDFLRGAPLQAVAR